MTNDDDQFPDAIESIPEDEFNRVMALPDIRGATLYKRPDRFAVYLLIGDLADPLEIWLADFSEQFNAFAFAVAIRLALSEMQRH